MAFMSSRDEHCSWLQVPTGKLHPPHWQISPSAMAFTVGLEVAPRALTAARTATTKTPEAVLARILTVLSPQLLIADPDRLFLALPDLGHFALHAAGDKSQKR